METGECLEMKYCRDSVVCKYIVAFMDFLINNILLFKAILYKAKEVYMGMGKNRTGEG